MAYSAQFLRSGQYVIMTRDGDVLRREEVAVVERTDHVDRAAGNMYRLVAANRDAAEWVNENDFALYGDEDGASKGAQR